MINALTEKHLENAHKHYSNEEYVKALDSIEKVLHIHNNNMNAIFFRGKCYMKLKKYSEASDDFSKTTSDKNFDISGGIGLRILIRKISNSKEAEVFVNDLINKMPENEHIRFVFAEYLYRNGEYVNAIDEFEKSISLGRRINNYSYDYIAKCWTQLGNNEKAIENLTHAINNSIDNYLCKTSFYYERAKCFFSNNEYDSAYTDAIRALKYHEEHPILNEKQCNDLYEYINKYNDIAEAY